VDDLEPFLSECLDERLPARLRLGSYLYLAQRETFLTAAEQAIIESARLDIQRALLVELTLFESEYIPRATQGTLFD
jgi:hypothetical protein